MKKIWIIALVVLAIPLALAFSGSNSNYKIKYAIDGMGLAQGTSASYKVRSNLLFQPVGKFQSTDYKLYLGHYHVIYPPDTTPPIITILSPQNTTYTATSFYLKVSLNEATSWIGYSLDSKANVILWTNKPAGTYDTYVQASLGSHNVIVYANDTFGNMGNSSKVYFTLKSGGGGGSCLIRGICAIEY
jgi:hypothetical protein